MRIITVVTIMQFTGNNAKTLFDPQVFHDRKDAEEFIDENFGSDPQWDQQWENNMQENLSDESKGQIYLFQHTENQTEYVRIYLKVKDLDSGYKSVQSLENLTYNVQMF